MLTSKEKQILEMQGKGLTQTEIAARLKISQPAVSSFKVNAIRKINEAKDTMDFVRKLKIRY